jgi:hypothetical protein
MTALKGILSIERISDDLPCVAPCVHDAAFAFRLVMSDFETTTRQQGTHRSAELFGLGNNASALVPKRELGRPFLL